MTSISNWVKQKLKEFDFLGEGINFTINNEPHLKTVSGGILRFILYLIGVFLFFFFGKDFLFKLNPRIYYEIKESLEPIEINYRTNDFFFALRFEDIKGLSITNISDYFHLLASYDKFNTIINTFTPLNIPFVLCSELIFDETTEKFFKTTNKSEFLCPSIPKNTNLTLLGSWTDASELVYNMNIKLSLCLDLESKTNKDCKNYKKFFNEILGKGNVYVRLMTKDVKFDKDDYKTPLKNQITSLFTPLSKNLVKRGNIFFSKSHLVQDNGVIFASEQSLFKVGVSKFTQNDFFFFESIKSDDEVTTFTNDYFIIDISTDSRYKYYSRKYMKFQDLLAQLNGFMNLMILITQNVYVYYYQYILRTYLFNKLVRVSESDFNSKINLRAPGTLKNDFTHSKNLFQSGNRDLNFSDQRSKKNNEISMLKICSKSRDNNYLDKISAVNKDKNKVKIVSDVGLKSKENESLKSSGGGKNKPELNTQISNVDLNQMRLNNDNSRIELNKIDELDIKCPQNVEAHNYTDKIIESFVKEKNEIKFSFWENLKINLLKKDKAANNKHYLKSEQFSKLFLDKFDAFYYLKKMKNLSVMKKCLLEENELSILDFISNKYYSIEKTDNQAIGNINSKKFMVENIKSILQSEEKNRIKKHLLEELLGKDTGLKMITVL